ncbi:MAG: response regulator transcription factor [Saprospiraceae bacterium]|nr:response regulator transcription factor [Saprospiraceae bacterium]
MKCIIIEDQPPAQRVLKKYIDDLGTLELTGTFSDAIKALEFLQSNEVDLIFLDIHLPKISGIDFLKTLSNPPAVILTTAFPDYALESYEFNVVDYLLKPFSFQRFVKSIAKVPQKNPGIRSEAPNASNLIKKDFFVKSGYEHIRVNQEDILFIKSDADYTEVHLKEKKLLTSEPLRHWEEELQEEHYYRIHKSYLINTQKIEKVTATHVYLHGGMSIPIGRAFKEAFFERFVK